jgi:hypothetical protein
MALVGKGLKALNVLIHKTKHYAVKHSVMCQLFGAFVAASLNCGCEKLGFGKSKEIERVHLKFCEQLLNVKMSTCTKSIYGELGRFPMYNNRYVRIIKF